LSAVRKPVEHGTQCSIILRVVWVDFERRYVYKEQQKTLTPGKMLVNKRRPCLCAVWNLHIMAILLIYIIRVN